MLDKRIEFPGVSESGEVQVQAIFPSLPAGEKEKIASQHHPEVADFIHGLRPIDGKSYVLINALGAGEAYGTNFNGDYFEETELKKVGKRGHKTFLNAGVYMNHANKNKDNSLGRVVLSVYNEYMRRVELIVELDRKKCADMGHSSLLKTLDSGGNPPCSMGCRVPYDVCSICEYKSRRKGDNCGCINGTEHRLREVLPDGRQVFVYNRHCMFHDISFVPIGADEISFAMQKVAHVLLAGMMEKTSRKHVPIRRSRTINKLAAIEKRIPAMSVGLLPQLEKKPTLPMGVLRRMSVSSNIPSILTGSSSMGMVLKPQEYQTIILIKLKRPALAERLYRTNSTFGPSPGMDQSVPFGHRGMDYSVIRDILAPFMQSRSMLGPCLMRRPTTVSLAVRRPKSIYEGRDTGLMEKIASSYNGYRFDLLQNFGRIVSELTLKDSSIMKLAHKGSLEEAFAENGIDKMASRFVTSDLICPQSLAAVFGAYEFPRQSTKYKSAGSVTMSGYEAQREHALRKQLEYMDSWGQLDNWGASMSLGDSPT